MAEQFVSRRASSWVACLLLAFSSLAVAADDSLYIIQFEQPGALHYKGGTDGLAATSALVRSLTAGNRTAVSQDQDLGLYFAHLARLRGAQSQAIEESIGRRFTARFNYKVAFFGMATSMTGPEAARVANLTGVRRVFESTELPIQTDAGPEWIGADTIWDGNSTPLPSQGEGVVVGVLDTGINLAHPSFSDMPEDGHQFDNPYGDGVFVGDCDGVNFVCNNKLIGAWDFADGGSENDGPEDNNGHGTHVASVAVGNRLAGPFTETFSGEQFDVAAISGVAPHANIISYDVCSSSCQTAAILAAIDQAIVDGVDILNVSIAGGLSPWSDVDRGLLDAVAAGITVVTAAGNGTAVDGAVQHLGPWVISTAGQSHHRARRNSVSVNGAGPELTDLYGLLGGADNFAGMDVVAPARYAGHIDPSNAEGCSAWPGGNEFDGAIAVISRGTCSFASKINHAQAAGASAAVIFNHLSVMPIAMPGIGGTTLPSLMVGLSAGQSIVDHLNDNPDALMTLSGSTEVVRDTDYGSVLYANSLRGPNNSLSVTKPDLAAPAVFIFGAIAEQFGPSPQLSFLTGTSAASPHAAGAAALLKSIRPSWSPAEIRSALMLSARNGFDDFGQLASVDQEGAGTIDLEAAARAGLIMDETVDAYLAADPDNGGDPATLNLPSMRSNACDGQCIWQRTLCLADDADSHWTSSVDAPVGTTIDVSPSELTFFASDALFVNGFDGDLNLSACQTIEVTLTVNDPQLVTDAEVVFGTVVFVDGAGAHSDTSLSVAAFPVGPSSHP